MIFAEGSARLILVLHTVVAVACVGATTHLALWLRPYRRRQFSRQRAVRRFAWISVGLYFVTFVGGNLIYPTYKVRVRAQFLEDPSAVTREAQDRAKASERVERLYGPPRALGTSETVATTTPTEQPAENAAKIARWFDVKEHWVALGFALAIALAVILSAWKPRRETAVLGPIVFWMAVASASAVWLGAIIGVVVSSYRAVGAL